MLYDMSSYIFLDSEQTQDFTKLNLLKINQKAVVFHMNLYLYKAVIFTFHVQSARNSSAKLRSDEEERK
jgi:hypothetical protein